MALAARVKPLLTPVLSILYSTGPFLPAGCWICRHQPWRLQNSTVARSLSPLASGRFMVRHLPRNEAFPRSLWRPYARTLSLVHSDQALSDICQEYSRDIQNAPPAEMPWLFHSLRDACAINVRNGHCRFRR